MSNLFWRLGGLAVALGIAVSFAPPAHANLITFNSATAGNLLPTPYTENGFVFTYRIGDRARVQNVGGADQNVIVDANVTNSSGSELKITRQGGGFFTLASVDIANLSNPGSPVTVSSGSGFRIELKGNNGGDDVYGPGSSSFTTVTPSDLVHEGTIFLSIVGSTGTDFAVDNFVLNAVPEPASALLLALGLLGLGFVLRKPIGREVVSKVAG